MVKDPITLLLLLLICHSCDSQVYNNPCGPNPCVNGGKCKPIGTRFICGCPPGFSGSLCEVYNNPCRPNPCVNGGKCKPIGTRFICGCPPGFSGSLCEDYNNPCRPNPCVNGGKCKPKGTRFSCGCPPGYSGSLCEVYNNPCRPNLCVNGGKCKPIGTRFICGCPPGFSGSLCEVYNNPCRPNPCVNGGKCKPIGTRFICGCPPGFSGSLCEAYSKSPCRLRPCQNGGTCTPKGTGYSCACSPGYSDVNCTVCSTKKLDILFIEDVSFSISKPRFDEMKRFQESMLNSTTISPGHDHVALMVFSSSARVVFKLNTYINKSDVLEALKQQTYEEGPTTNISDAIKVATRQVFNFVNGDRLYDENMVVMFTDGYTTSEDREAIAASIGDLKAKAEVFVVAISEVDANPTVNMIASKPSNVFHIDTPNAVSAIQKRMKFCVAV